MIIVSLLLLVFVVIGAMQYLHFRQEQDKTFQEDKYEQVRDEVYRKRKPQVTGLEEKLRTSDSLLASLVSFNHVYILLATLIAGLIGTLLYCNIVYGPTILPLVLLMVFPIALPSFPYGLFAFISQAYNAFDYMNFSIFAVWTPYFFVFVFGSFIKNRAVFIFIYLIFIMLLLMNIIGCAKILPDFTSGYN